MTVTAPQFTNTQTDFIRTNFDVLEPIRRTTSKNISGLHNCKVIILVTNHLSVALNTIHKQFISLFEGKNGCMFIEGHEAREWNAGEFRRFDGFPNFKLKTYPTLEGEDHPENPEDFVAHENLKWDFAAESHTCHENLDRYAQKVSEVVTGALQNNQITSVASNLYIDTALDSEHTRSWPTFYAHDAREAKKALNEFESKHPVGNVTNQYYDTTEASERKLQLTEEMNFIFMDEANVLGNMALLESLSANTFKIKVLAPTLEWAKLIEMQLKQSVNAYEAIYSLTLRHGDPNRYECYTFDLFEQHRNYFSGQIKASFKPRNRKENSVATEDMGSLVDMAKKTLVFNRDSELRKLRIVGIDYFSVARFQSQKLPDTPFIISVPADLVTDSHSVENYANKARLNELEARRKQREQWRDDVLDQFFALKGIAPILKSTAEITGKMKVMDHDWVFELETPHFIELDFEQGLFRNDIADFFRAMLNKELSEFTIPAGNSLKLTTRQPIQIEETDLRKQIEAILTTGHKFVVAGSSKKVQLTGDFQVTGDFQALQIGPDGSIELKAFSALKITIVDPAIVVPENAPKKRRVMYL